MKINNSSTILLAEDDPNLSILLKDFLEIMGYRVILCQDGKSALENFSEEIDLCIFDVMMPQKDGFTLAKEIRARDPYKPIIFLTAKTLQEDRIKGFMLGCDDYLTKPFSTEELHYRIQAILRRINHKEAAEDFRVTTIGEYTFDTLNMNLRFRDEEPVSLTRKECELLQVLCQNRNKLLPREFVLKKIWGTDDYFIGRSMDVFITKLRKHLRHDPDISITNVHGVGFRLEVPLQKQTMKEK